MKKFFKKEAVFVASLYTLFWLLIYLVGNATDVVSLDWKAVSAAEFAVFLHSWLVIEQEVINKKSYTRLEPGVEISSQTNGIGYFIFYI